MTLRFSDLPSRLARLPADLPAPPPELTPILLAGVPGAVAPSVTGGLVRDAAVLVLLYPDDAGRAVVLLTERSPGHLRHSGEVSFPGGAVESSDDGWAGAALREAREEVGLDEASSSVAVIGDLSPFVIPVSRFRVHPVVATCAARPVLQPDPREVAALIEAPLESFLPGAPIEVVEAERGGRWLRYGGYRIGSYHVWGATARVLGQLGAILG
jgi:8-oxo-dGTP pyrophosphatase MutT (NUDIX family)